MTYEVSSWGSLLVHWHVNPDGTGEIWRGKLGQREVRKFRFRLDGDALRTFIANVEDVRKATHERVPCKKEIFDLPYGHILWDYPGAPHAYAFDAGCRSEKADEVQDILTAANSNIETLAKIETKPYIVESFP